MDRSTFFTRHAPTWETERPEDLEDRLARVVGLAAVQAGHTVLDIGTGTGVLLPHLLRAVGPAGRIAALDLSAGMVAVARQKGFPSQVALLQADVHDLPFPDEAFDRVTCNAALPHFANRERSLREMSRVLRPGGLLAISHPIGREAVNARHRQAGGPVAEDRVPPPETMAHLLQKAGLEEAAILDEPCFYMATAKRKPLCPNSAR